MAEKGAQKARMAAMAGRLKHLRETKFELEGFKSNEPTPSLGAAGAMCARNKRKMQALTPVPSSRG